MPPPLSLLHRARRRVLVHRRTLAALCVAAAAVLALRTLTGAPPPTTPVWTARHDVASGTVLRAQDFRRTGYAVGSAPPGSVRDLDRVVGRTLATPLEAGEPVSVRKLVGRSRLAGYPGRAAVAVRLPDVALATLLKPGDVVDLVQSDPRNATARRIVQGAVVLTVVDEPGTGALTAGSDGRLVVFAVHEAEVEVLSAAPAAGFLTVVWMP